MIAAQLTITAPDRVALITAITDLQACLRTRLACEEPQEAIDGSWCCEATVWARTERERAQEDLAAVQLIARVIRQRRPPTEDDRV